MQALTAEVLKAMIENPSVVMHYELGEKGIKLRRARPGDDEAQLVSGSNIEVLTTEMRLSGISVD
jgi:hypothetical protein